MININLVPFDEIENKHWYLADVVYFAFFLTISLGGVQIYLNSIENIISTISQETQEISKNTQRLSPDLKKFDRLSSQVKLLKEKIKILKELTYSKVTRYKPILLLEMIQNLYPKGLWVSQIIDDTENSIIRIEGGSFDMLLVAEFITSLDSTRYQQKDPGDIRTFLYFSKVHLEKITAGNHVPVELIKNNKKLSKTQKLFQKNNSKGISSNSSGDFNSATSSRFPEISDFPVYNLSLKYNEKNSTTKKEISTKIF